MYRNLLFYFVILLGTIARLVAQAANDLFQNAIELSGTFVEGKAALTNATFEAAEPNVSGMEQTVWYKWKAPESGTANFNVVGSNGKQVSAAAYFGSWPELRLIAYGLKTTAASLKFPVAKSQTILFQVGREASVYVNRADTALWTISLQTIGSILDGLSVAGPATVESDSFSSPVLLSGEESTGISYPLAAEHGPTNPNDAGFNNSWYRWIAPHSGTVRVKCSTPWPTLLYSSPTDKKTVGIFTGPDLPNLTTIATARGTGEIVATFEAIGGQTYYISVGKQTTDAVLGWVITTLTQTPVVVAPIEIERAVRLRINTVTGKKYQVQVTSDLKTWSNLGEPLFGTGSPEWIYSPTTDLKEKIYRILEISP